MAHYINKSILFNFVYYVIIANGTLRDNGWSVIEKQLLSGAETMPHSITAKNLQCCNICSIVYCHQTVRNCTYPLNFY